MARCLQSASSIFVLAAVVGGLFAVPSVAAQSVAEPPAVRVHLFERDTPRAVTVRVAEGRQAAVFAGAGGALMQLDEGDELIVSQRGDELRVTGPDGSLFARTLRLAPEDVDAFAPAWQVEVTEGRGHSGARSYPGALALSLGSGALRIVNTVGLEPYVAGVAASEYGFADLEGNKAQAVAARTYVLRTLQQHGPGHVLPDHVGAQVYRGTERITPQVRRAVEETTGEVAVHGGALIHAVYHASSGGHTASNEDVWNAGNGALPYLRAHPDPHDDASPHHNWRVSLDRSRLLTRLSKRYGFRVRGFRPAEHSSDGRVARIELMRRGGPSHYISGNDFRLFANRQTGGRGLRSTLFAADREGSHYVFEGSGYGHGVGMNQNGAHAMAQAGHSYQDILAFYYPGISLARIGEDAGLLQPTLTDATPLQTPDADSTPERVPPPPAAEDQSAEETSRERIGW